MDIKLGPAFFSNGNKQMMTMTPPINAFLYGFDVLMAGLNKDKNIGTHSIEFQNIINSTVNNLVADILLYFQNRVGLSIGKEVSITSIPTAKSMCEKYFKVDIKTLIGDRGYQELKKIDEYRGIKQHKNDRYFSVAYRINKTNINSIKDFDEYIIKIKKIIIELDSKLEKIKPLYDVKVSSSVNQTTIEMHSLGHSFDLKNMKINGDNKKTDNPE